MRLAVAVTLAMACAPQTAPAAGPGEYSPPDWWPLRGSNLVGCTRLSPGCDGGSYHPVWALDVGGPEGQPVYASGSGLAKVYSNVGTCTTSGYGRAVVIEHGGAVKSLYGHMSAFSAQLAASPGGVWVDRNTVIGYIGHTGHVEPCTFNHLHYEETTNGGFWASATDPGPLKACIGGRLTTYPQEWGRGSWSGLPTGTFTARSDGTGCSGPVGDGGLIRTPNGNVYRIVGGAPLHLSRCDYTNGCAGVVNVPDLAGYRDVPADGALARNVDDGAIYRFAGGAPLWISSCDYAPGCGGVVEVDSHAFNVNDHMRPVPADGTLISNRADGGIYRFAGGAPLWISSCDYAPGCAGVVNLDGGTFARNGAISGAARMRPYPAGGTLISNQADGGIYRFAGGAPLWISSCDYAPGCAGVVNLDGGTFARNGAISGAPRMRALPREGTYLRRADTNAPLRVAGGAALAVTDCRVLDYACAGAVRIDRGTLQQHGAISGAPRLNWRPASGTVLQGRPSNVLWKITNGNRQRAPGLGAGVQINDATIARFPLVASPTAAVAQPPQPAAPAAEAPRWRIRITNLRLRGRRLTGRLHCGGACPATVRLKITTNPRRASRRRLVAKGSLTTAGKRTARFRLRTTKKWRRHPSRLRITARGDGRVAVAVLRRLRGS